jgi:aconitate hydratase
LGLTFVNKEDYDKFQEDDTIATVDMKAFSPGKTISLELQHADGSKDTVACNHSYNENQIAWFYAGSALNLIKEQNG